MDGLEIDPSGREIVLNCQGQGWGPHSLLYNKYRFSFPGVKRPELGFDHPPESSEEVEEIVELYIYTPLPAGPS
jgi:hypothetical protein